MKNLHLTFAFLLLSLAGFGQQWKPYKIDDSVQVSLPEQFTKKDTLGQTLITADAPFGLIQISITPDNPKRTPDIEKERHIKRYYDDFLKRLRASSKGGIVSNEKDTTLGKLKVKDFTLAVDSGSGKQYRNIRILHEAGNTYVFQFLYSDIHTEWALPESKKFFNSIRIPPDLGLESQFTDPENTTGTTPPGGKKRFIIPGAILLVIILAVILIRRRRRS